MTEINVYIANLGKYNEGELVGAWFTAPVDYEDVQEKVGLNAEYEEYAIHDYESPIPIPEYISLEELNYMANLLEELANEPYIDVIDEILACWFSDLEELVEHKDDIVFYQGYSDIQDIAYDYVEEGLFGDVPEYLKMYLDYSSIARDLEINGNFLITSHGIAEYI